MFTKTDLAKFENVWDDHPRWVNLGSQKNFARYAARIGSEWEKSSDAFNEFYFKRAVARGLLFRATERIVSAQPWYNGGYRANIVAYTLAIISDITKFRKASVDFLRVWNTQMVNSVLEEALALVSRQVNDDIIKPPLGISNISEWCKKEACWTRIQARTEAIANLLSQEFYDQLVSKDNQIATERSAKRHKGSTTASGHSKSTGCSLQRMGPYLPIAARKTSAHAEGRGCAQSGNTDSNQDSNREAESDFAGGP